MRNLINDAGINYKDLDGLVYGLLVIAINNISEVKTTNPSLRFSTSLLMDSAWRSL